MKYSCRIYDVSKNGNIKENTYPAEFKGNVLKIYTGWNRFSSKQVFVIDKSKIKMDYIDENNLLHFSRNIWEENPSLLQLRRKMETQDLLDKVNPVDSDTKYGAIVAIQRMKESLMSYSLWSKIAPYVGLFIMAAVFIIAFAMLMNNCGG